MLLVLRVLLFGTPFPLGGPGRIFGRAILWLFLFKMLMSLYYATPHWIALQLWDGMTPLPWRMVVWLVGAAIVSRLCLIYPNAALGEGWRLRGSWRDASGNAIGLFSIYLLAVLPGLAIGEILEIAIRLSAKDFGGSFTPTALIMLAALKRIAISVILLALFTVAFVRLTGYPAVGVSGSGKSAEQLAEAFD